MTLYLPIPLLQEIRERDTRNKIPCRKAISYCLAIAVQCQAIPITRPCLEENGGNGDLVVKYGHWKFKIYSQYYDNDELRVVDGEVFNTLLQKAVVDLVFAISLQTPDSPREDIGASVLQLLPEYWPEPDEEMFSLPQPTVYNDKSGHRRQFEVLTTEPRSVRLVALPSQLNQQVCVTDDLSVHYTKSSWDSLKDRFDGVKLAYPSESDTWDSLAVIEVDLSSFGNFCLIGAIVRLGEGDGEQRRNKTVPLLVSIIESSYDVLMGKAEELTQALQNALETFAKALSIVLVSYEGLQLQGEESKLKVRTRTDKKAIAVGLSAHFCLEPDDDGTPGRLCAFHIHSAAFAAPIVDGSSKRAVGLLTNVLTRFESQTVIDESRELGLNRIANNAAALRSAVEYTGDNSGVDNTNNGVESLWSALKRRRSENGDILMARAIAGCVFDLLCYFAYRLVLLGGQGRRLKMILPSPGGLVAAPPRILEPREIAKIKLNAKERVAFPKIGPKLAGSFREVMTDLQGSIDAIGREKDARRMLRKLDGAERHATTIRDQIRAAKVVLSQLIELDNAMSEDGVGKQVFDFALERCGKRQRTVGPPVNDMAVVPSVEKAMIVGAALDDAVEWMVEQGQSTAGHLQEERSLVLRDDVMDGFAAIESLVGRRIQSIVDECRAGWETAMAVNSQLGLNDAVTALNNELNTALINLQAQRLTVSMLPMVSGVLGMTILIAKEGGVVEKYGQSERMIGMYLSDEENRRYQLIVGIS